MFSRQFALSQKTTVCVLLVLSVAASAAAAELRINRDGNSVSIFDNGKPVLRYHYADVAKKPYVDQLFTPAGVQILRDSPDDHKHHHALMYALAVDGVNFWEEHEANSGCEVHKKLLEVKATTINALGDAKFVEDLEWVGPKSEKPVLLERRAIDVLQSAHQDATLVRWCCCLQTPPGKDSAIVTGHHYYGLGMRFLVSMDKDGRFFNADDLPGENINGQRLTPVKWCAYTAKADGKPVTVALFDHPSNLRYPAKMFSMTAPFAYLSATLNAWKEPITLKAGQPLNLCYGVALWDGEVDKATVEKMYQRWLSLTTPPKASSSK